MALIGYARVSSVGQALAVQRDRLKHCNKVFEEQRNVSSILRQGFVEFRDDRLRQSAGRLLSSSPKE